MNTSLQKLRKQTPAVVLIVFGLFVSFVGGTYPVGGLTRMGPGFLPVALGVVLVVVGIAVLLGTTPVFPVTPPVTPLEAGHPDRRWVRPLAAVTSGMLAWVLLSESIGFVPAGIAQVVLTSFGLAGAKWRTMLLAAFLMSVIGYVIFVVELGVPLRAFGT